MTYESLPHPCSNPTCQRPAEPRCIAYKHPYCWACYNNLTDMQKWVIAGGTTD
jgi:hypothetical protein